MAANRGVSVVCASRVRLVFKHFLQQTRPKLLNTTTIPAACFCTDKEGVNSNPFFEKYGEKIKRVRGDER